jgi:hypothetical protein
MFVICDCAGISDLLRVLSQRASEVLKAEDEEDDDGMEVEQSEGDGDESSGSEDHSSELDEEQQQSLKVRSVQQQSVDTCTSTCLVAHLWKSLHGCVCAARLGGCQSLCLLITALSNHSTAVCSPLLAQF